MIFLSIMFLMLSCSNGSLSPEKDEVFKAKESLKLEAEIANKMAGKSVDFMTRWISCDFDGNNLIYTYEIDEDYATIDQMRSIQQETMAKSIKNTLESTPQFAGTKANLAKIKGKVIYNYVGDTSKKVMTITIDF